MSEIQVGQINSTDGSTAITTGAGGTVTLSAALTAGGALAMGANNISFSNGNGIDFSASEGSGASSSVLDDYEEGTFTPTVPTGMTGTLDGRYVKIGQMVFAHFKFASLDVGTSSGDFTAQLPFSPISNNWRYGGIVNELFNPAFSSSGTTIITPTIESGVLKIRRFDHNGGGDARMQTSVFTTDFLTIQVWYETAS